MNSFSKRLQQKKAVVNSYCFSQGLCVHAHNIVNILKSFPFLWKGNFFWTCIKSYWQNWILIWLTDQANIVNEKKKKNKSILPSSPSIQTIPDQIFVY